MKTFKKIYIEISNICNLQCSFCPEVERGKKIMSAEDFSATLAQAKSHTEQITLHLMGEPLAHPQFAEILAACDEYQVKINLTTNGLLIPRHQELLLKSQVLEQINFSVHSFKDNFPQKEIAPYLDQLIEFTFKLRETSPKTYINFRLWNLRLDLAHYQINQMIIQKLNESFGSQLDDKVDVGFKKSKKISDQIYLNFDSQFRWPNLSDPIRSATGTCYGLDSHIAIHADGTVVPCCLDKEAKINLGNIHHEGLDKILASSRVQKMQAGFKCGDLVEELCQKCTFIKRFDKKAHLLKNERKANIGSTQAAPQQ